jgi:hypothetical protein
VAVRVPHAPSSGEDSLCHTTAGLDWVFFCLLCLCISFVSPVQSAFVVPIFYWNICWLVARSALFYFESERYCKERLKCYFCKSCVFT